MNLYIFFLCKKKRKRYGNNFLFPIYRLVCVCVCVIVYTSDVKRKENSVNAE